MPKETKNIGRKLYQYAISKAEKRKNEMEAKDGLPTRA